MSLKITWVAARGLPKAEVLAALGLVETPAWAGMWLPEAACLEYPGGWTVVQYGRPGVFGDRHEPPQTLTGEVVWGLCTEIVMWSGAYGRDDTGRRWSVVHSAGEGSEDVAVAGTPPPEFAAIRDELLQKQSAEDEPADHLFEAPLALTQALCGYDPDYCPDMGRFRVLEPRRSGKAGERQLAEIAYGRRLEAAVVGDLMASATALGFQPGEAYPNFIRSGSPAEMVRVRGDTTDVIEFRPEWRGGSPRIGITMFQSEGTGFRRGEPGCAFTSDPRRGLVDTLLGRRQEPETAMARVIAESHDLFGAVDRYLKDGSPDKRLRPPRYEDRRPSTP